jgi:Fe-Mn family superoxide dismutase
MSDVLPPPPPFPPTAPETVITPQALQAQIDRVTLIDCRRHPAFADATQVIAGAEWRDPEIVLRWMPAVPKDRPVVVYCKYGQEVSLFVAGTLRARGYDARSLVGGIAAWTESGGALQSKHD